MRHLPISACVVLASVMCLSARAQVPVLAEVQKLLDDAHAAQQSNHDDAAILDYQKIIQLQPELPQAYNNLGRLLYNANSFQEAVAILKKGLSLDSSMVPAQIMLGASYLQLGQPSDAIAPLQAGVRAFPTDRFARLTLAQALIQAGQGQAAIPQLEELIRLDPKDQQAWYTLGKLHLQLSQQALLEVQHINPDAPIAHELEGEVMESLENTPGAIAEYKKAVALAPTDPSPLRHLAYLFWKTGEWPQARDNYQLLLRSQPEDCKAHWRLADTLDELDEHPEQALHEIDTALAECPTLVQAHAERARLLLRTGKPADAIVDLKIAEAAAPDEPSIQSLLAKAYRATGDRAKANQANLRFQQMEQAQHAGKEQHAASVMEANHN